MVDFVIQKKGARKKTRSLDQMHMRRYPTEFDLGRSTARLYKKIHEKFGNDAEAFAMLGVGEINVSSVKTATEKEVRALTSSWPSRAGLVVLSGQTFRISLKSMHTSSTKTSVDSGMGA
jgi:hypothetical protein